LWYPHHISATSRGLSWGTPALLGASQGKALFVERFEPTHGHMCPQSREAGTGIVLTICPGVGGSEVSDRVQGLGHAFVPKFGHP
jgi:hypothetical protein